MNKKIIWGVVIVVVVIAACASIVKYKDSYVTQISDDSRSWLTYKNSQAGYELMYPPALFLNGVNDPQGWLAITQQVEAPQTGPNDLCGDSKDYIQIKATDNYTHEESDDFTNEGIAADEHNYVNTGGKKVSDEVVNGQRTVRFDGSKDIGPLQIMIRGKNRLDVYYQKCAGGSVPFDNIVSTLKFTSPATTNINDGVATPFISSISPTSGPVGTLVTVIGTGFASSNGVNVGISESSNKAWSVESVTPTKLTFKIPANLPMGQHSITVFTGEKYTPTSNKVQFNVTQLTTPSITVLSPNGGEKFQVGKTYEIRWNAPLDTTRVRLFLVDDRTGSRQAEPLSIGSVEASIGKYSWTIPSTIVPNSSTDKGSFKIEINETSLRGYTDTSDNTFTITN